MYVDDLAPDGALHATFVRSVMAHAEIGGIDTAEAESMPGVVAIFTAESLGLQALPPSMGMLNQEMLRTWLASDRVRYVGEPVALIISETAEQGVDAVESVIVDYEPLDAVVDMRDAAKGDTLLFPDVGSNVAFAIPGKVDDEFWDGCDVRVTLLSLIHI